MPHQLLPVASCRLQREGSEKAKKKQDEAAMRADGQIDNGNCFRPAIQSSWQGAEQLKKSSLPEDKKERQKRQENCKKRKKQWAYSSSSVLERTGIARLRPLVNEYFCWKIWHFPRPNVGLRGGQGQQAVLGAVFYPTPAPEIASSVGSGFFDSHRLLAALGGSERVS